MKIAVLMSTYNGEKYLQEQIESILSQKLNENWHLTLLIRDDGSHDMTNQIIKSYAHHYDNIIDINTCNPIHKGIKDSFLSLLKIALEKNEFDYFAFSDQDDVWMEDKLVSAITILENSHNEKGALYYSNKIIVDNELHIQNEEHIHYYDDFTETLWLSLAAGNTMVFNSKLAKLAGRHYSQMALFHDGWVYRLAKCLGSDIFFDDKAHIYYRQYSDNTVGYVEKLHSSWPYMIKNFIPNLIKPRDHFFQNQLKEIDELYQEYIDGEMIDKINIVLDYNKNFKSKWALLTDSNMRKRSFLDQCIWIYKILFNML